MPEPKPMYIPVSYTHQMCIRDRHEYGDYVVGRMGIPYRQRGVSVISVVVDAPNAVISAMSGKLGMLPDVNTKTIYAKEKAKKGDEKNV